MGTPLRFGLVGCGVIGLTHAEGIAALDDAQLVAVVDEDQARAAKLETRYGVATYSDLQQMLASERIDVVDICTPSGMHGAQAVQAMRAGCHVLVEKPMDIRREALDEMLAVQQQTGMKLAVISQHRFDPAAQRVRELISGGMLGRLVLGSANVAWWRAQSYYNSGGWRGTRALDGGMLLNQAIHSIDVLQWLMGPVVSVFAYCDTLAHDIEHEDVTSATVRFASGAVGTIAATTAAYPGDLTRIEVFGDKGSAIIENNRLAHLRLAGDDGASAITVTDPLSQEANSASTAFPAPGSHAYQIADLIRAIREDGTPAIDGYQGRLPVDIILAIYESARTGQEVRLR